jgi:hypothetical protein
MRDRELLDRDRRVVDRDLADRVDRATERAGDPGHQLGDAERYGRGQHAGERSGEQGLPYVASSSVCHALYSQ